jgi:CMP/dCMP kinase
MTANGVSDGHGSGRPFIVAIDGPAGAGKSTAARRLAARLGFAMVDTGAIYRTVALAATRAGIPHDDDRGLAELLPSVLIRFEPAPAGQPDAGQRVFLGGEDVSLEIRTPAMSLGASAVSARPVVRAGLLDLQRRLATAPGHPGAVLEGRDIGTVVFPDADVKFFLTASPEIRARRRCDELAAKGQRTPLDQVLADQRKRDRDDAQRAVAPLRPAADAVLIDTSQLGPEAVVESLAAAVEARLAGRGRADR